MHGLSLLKKWCERNELIGHQARLEAMLRVVAAVLAGSKLSLTHLGRCRAGAAFVKHHIKAVDRLLGNRHLHAERRPLYSALARTVLAGCVRPLVIVDWADCELERQLLILRAAVPLGGRTFTLYEEVHPLSRYNSPKTHRRFLHALHQVLPQHCRPIIVTDAGFRGPWFRDVEALGWDWIGRIRNTIKYFKPETGRWCYVHSLYPTATPKVQHLGERVLSKRLQYRCRLYLVRAYKRAPGRPRKKKSYGTNDGLYRRLHRSPWLLATSLPHHRHAAKQIVKAYAARMQIEEAFRDLKSHRWGHALRYARSKNTARLEVLLMLALLATFVLWLLGIAAKSRGWQRHFQANTEKRRNVLSIPFLGKAVIAKPDFRITSADLAESLSQLISLARAHSLYV